MSDRGDTMTLALANGEEIILECLGRRSLYCTVRAPYDEILGCCSSMSKDALPPLKVNIEFWIHRQKGIWLCEYHARANMKRFGGRQSKQGALEAALDRLVGS